MDNRFLLSAFVGVFFFVLIVASITTYRHISHRWEPVISRPS
jgi:hypothetical protein